MEIDETVLFPVFDADALLFLPLLTSLQMFCPKKLQGFKMSYIFHTGQKGLWIHHGW